MRRNGRPFAFAVDRMLGQHEVVVRPVEDPLVRVAGVSGSTDLGDGRPVLVTLAVGLCGLAGLVVTERRLGDDAMLPPFLFASR